MYQRLKAQVGRLKINELYTLLLITFGIPAIFYLYFSWRAALTVFIITQVALGIIRERE